MSDRTPAVPEELGALLTGVAWLAGITRREDPEGQVTDPGRVQTTGLDQAAPDYRALHRAPQADGLVFFGPGFLRSDIKKSPCGRNSLSSMVVPKKRRRWS
jgi:hypothetical protein